MITVDNDWPFVLVELVMDPDEPAGFRIAISAGGGISDGLLAGALLRLAANGLPKELAE